MQALGGKYSALADRGHREETTIKSHKTRGGRKDVNDGEDEKR